LLIAALLQKNPGSLILDGRLGTLLNIKPDVESLKHFVLETL
jgi:hypothetical protein